MDIRFLSPEEYPMLNEFFQRENCPPLDPMFSRVVAAVDNGKVVGAMCLHLVAHAEPIWIDQAYQGTGLWKDLTDKMDGYLTELGRQGALYGVYTQPTREETKYICQQMGYVESPHPLWVKHYNQPPIDERT